MSEEILNIEILQKENKNIKKYKSLNHIIKNKLKRKIIIYILISIYYIYKTISKINNTKKTSERLLNYYEKCNKGINMKEEYYNNISNPKMSIIIPIYNSEKYLIRSLRSIQNQEIKEIEIIYINDGSTDKTYEILKREQKKDKRIKIINNEKNKGTFYSRKKGVLNSKGEYIGFIDADDIYIDNILTKGYNIMKKNNLDILQFNHIRFSENKFTYYRLRDSTNIIYNNESYLYKKNLISSFFLWNKIYKRDLLLKVYNIFNNEDSNYFLVMREEELIRPFLFKFLRSFKQIHENGVIYIFNNHCTSVKSKINNFLFSDLVLLKLYLKYSDNSIKDKNYFASYNINNLNVNNEGNITELLEFATEVLNEYNKDIFIKKKYKIKILNGLNKIINDMKNFKK